MSTAAIETKKTTVERWTADPSRTTVEFEVEHLWGRHAVRGRFSTFDGSYIVGPGGSTIELTIDAGSVDTGCPARDNQLSVQPTSSAPTNIRSCGSSRRASPDWAAAGHT